MNATNYYKVAEHIFSITAKEDLLQLLTNYQPFQQLESSFSSDALRFCLQVSDNNDTLPHESDLELFYTDSSDDDMPRIEIYKIPVEGETNFDWFFAVSLYKNTPVCCRFRANNDFTSATLWSEKKHIKFAIDNACMLLFAFSTIFHRTLEMHASVTVLNGKAYPFLGHSGTGKSTHSEQWQAAFPDAWLLNDDNPIIRVWDNGQVTIYGSPWSGKTPCYKNEQAPVGAIVKLSQAPYNKAQRLRLPEAYAYMLSSCSGLKIIPSMMDALYDTIVAVISVVPVYGMECLPNPDAAIVCYNVVNQITE